MKLMHSEALIASGTYMYHKPLKGNVSKTRMGLTSFTNATQSCRLTVADHLVFSSNFLFVFVYLLQSGELDHMLRMSK